MSTGRYTSSPNPDWKLGTKFSELTSESAKQWQTRMKENDFKVFDPSSLSGSEAYKILISGIIPRPIAFVSSLSPLPSAVPNLAPFSYFQMISHDPPLLIVSCSRGAKEKDTAANILATKEFTVNIMSDAFVEAANWTAVDAPSEVDEWVGSGLTPVASTSITPPRVAESAFSLECTLHSAQHFTSTSDPLKVTTTLLIGFIKLVHVRADVLRDKGDAVDPIKLQPVLRLGAIAFGSLGDVYDLPRPKWAEEKQEVEELYGKLRAESKI